MDKTIIDKFMVQWSLPVSLIFIITISVIAALRFGLKFDINRFLDSRKEKHRKLAQSACPHMQIKVFHNDKIQVQSWLISPFGTLNYVCSHCGASFYTIPDEEEFRDKVYYYLRKPELYKNALKDFNRHANKST